MIMRRCIDPVDLSAWVDGETTLRRSRAIQLHVEDCPRCAAQAAALQRVRQTVRLLAGVEFADGAQSLGGRRGGQRTENRQERAETQRLLKRLRAELTKEQARAIWGHQGRYSWRYGVFTPARRRGSWGWQGAVVALVLTVGAISVLRLPGLVSTTSPAHSGPTNGASPLPETDALARFYPDEVAVDTSDGSAGVTADMTGKAVGAATLLDTSTGTEKVDDSGGSRYQSYAPGTIRLMTGSDRQLETPSLVLWNDQASVDRSGVNGSVALGKPPAGSAGVRSSEAANDTRDSGREGGLGVGVMMASTAMTGVATAATVDAEPAPSGGTAALASADEPVGSVRSAAEAGAVGKRDGTKGATGGHPAVATTGTVVKRAAVAASAAAKAQTADETTSDLQRPDGDESESEYQKEHERFAATVWSDSTDYSEEALIRRVLLAAPTP